MPPKRTARPRAASYDIACRWRAAGIVAGERCDQVEPSHSQVSESSPEPSCPPKRTTRPRTESCAMAWPHRPSNMELRVHVTWADAGPTSDANRTPVRHARAPKGEHFDMVPRCSGADGSGGGGAIVHAAAPADA